MQLGLTMWQNSLRTAAFLLLVAASSHSPALAQDLLWEVVNPFRLYKNESAFKLHEDAFKALGGDRPGADRSQIVRLIERCLNDPASLEAAARDACTEVIRRHRTNTRLGWAASTLGDTCYDGTARPRRYPTTCDRERGTGRVTEDYVLPDSHAVTIELVPSRRQEARADQCIWSWKPRAGGNWVVAEPQPCVQQKLLDRVPYARDRAASGLEVKVELPDGRVFTETVVVEDLLVAALGDSFASGEGNPDKPVTFSAARGMDYRPPRPDPVIASATALPKSTFRLSAAPTEIKYDSFILPRRLLRDEQRGDGTQYRFGTDEFAQAFWERSPQWLSPDCHRSQYAFPMRVSLQLALEDRHRAITLIQLACSGAQVTSGMFQKLTAREHFDPTQNKTAEVLPQFDQLTRMICGINTRVGSEAYPIRLFQDGTTQFQDLSLRMQWCPPDKRKRDIDLVLLSTGGNDIGFSSLAAYSFLDHARDIAPLLGLAEHRIRFGTDVADVYLDALDIQMEALRRALDAGFGVKSSNVIHVSYERVEFDEDGKLCGDPARATLGMDAHGKFKIDSGRLEEVSKFLTRFFQRLECVSNAGPNCPQNLKTGRGTGFTLVVDHQPEFLRRGICARDPERAAEDGRMMRMPRIPVGTSGPFWPYSPSAYRPYAHRQHLFRTPNDAFLTANEHRFKTPLFDILQPAVAALLSGAFHPTAEAHSIVADHVVEHARRMLRERGASR
jgi:hypothetical protein